MAHAVPLRSTERVVAFDVHVWSKSTLDCLLCTVQVRDLLLNKIPFTGEQSPTLVAKQPLGSKDNSEDGTCIIHVHDSLHTLAWYSLYDFMCAGSSTDLLTASDKVTQNQSIDTTTRTDPIPVSRVVTDTSSSNTAGHLGESKDVTQSQPPRSADEAKTVASGGVANTSEAGSLEEDWVNVSLSPNHPLQLQSNIHPLENSGDWDYSLLS